ncbi:MAG: esterase [Caproiciproducens sp.]|nr:esterase [Caproiciproducens sp.]
MAFIQTNLFSYTLGFNTDINVFVPTPNSDEILNHKASGYFYEGARFQVLYLLHGAYGDYTDWMRLTSIEKYAQNHKIAVVMPSASNSFYQDMYRGSAYLTYLTEELPQFVQALFPVSRKRENTFTAGLSMGGYGALKLALTKPENYSCAASLSGALDIVDLLCNSDSDKIEGPFHVDRLFDSSKPIKGSDADLFALIARLKKQGRPLPRVFQSCGTEDFIYPINIKAKSKLETLGVDLTYEEHSGIHDWDYWDTHIQHVLDWLPLANNAVEE